MESISEPTPTKYEQVTVDVPEERLAEFHRFFARFLAGRGRRRRRGEYRRHAHGRGRACAGRHQRAEQGEAHENPVETSGHTPEIGEA